MGCACFMSLVLEIILDYNITRDVSKILNIMLYIHVSIVDYTILCCIFQ